MNHPVNHHKACTAFASMMITLVLTILFSIDVHQTVQGQATPPVKEVTTSQVIRTQVDDLQRENKHLKEDLARLQKDHKDLSATLDEYKPFLDNWKLVLTILGGSTLLTILWLAWAWLRKIPALVIQRCDDTITALFNERRDHFFSLLKGYDFDQEVKKRNKIILLTHRNGSDSYHHGLLSKHGFNVEPYTLVEVLANAITTLSPDDIIVINNEGGLWRIEEVQDFINSCPNWCFYIGRGALELEGDATSRFAASTVRAQFIGNLMNVLRYRSN